MKKILIIEDDQLVAHIYRNKFVAEHYQVETAPDGETGVEIIGKFNPDVVILDLMLPKMSGLDVLTKIRAQDNLKQLPVIVLSNSYLSKMVEQAWNAGATQCLSKANCTPRQVLEVVRGLEVPTANGVPQAATASAAPANADATSQAELHYDFLAGLPATLAASRAHLQSVVKSTDTTGRVEFFDELYRSIHALTANAGIAGEVDIAQMAEALEALLKELYDKPANINASTLRTVAMAIDCIGVLHERAAHPERPSAAPPTQPNILVVDDEAISRRAVTYALEKAKLSSTAVESPEAALKLLTENIYDIVFLDVDMPGMSGFELCAKLRSQPRHKTTPVVFVTSLSDFESRAHSMMSGGNDLIAKPFLFMELAVKALVYVLHGRVTKVAK